MIEKKQKEFNKSIIDFIQKYDVEFVNIENHFQELMFDYKTINHIDTGRRTLTLELKSKETEDKMAAKKKASKKVAAKKTAKKMK